MGKDNFHALRARQDYFILGWEKCCRLALRAIKNEIAGAKKPWADEVQWKVLVDLLFGIPMMLGLDFDISLEKTLNEESCRSSGPKLLCAIRNEQPLTNFLPLSEIRPAALLSEFNSSKFANGFFKFKPSPHPSLVAIRSFEILERWHRMQSSPESADALVWAMSLLGWSELAFRHSGKCEFCPRISKPGTRYCIRHTQSSPQDLGKKSESQAALYKAGLRASKRLKNIECSISLSDDLGLEIRNLLLLPYLRKTFELPDLILRIRECHTDDCLELDYLQSRLIRILASHEVKSTFSVNYARLRAHCLDEIEGDLLKRLGGHKCLEEYRTYFKLAALILEKESPLQFHHTTAVENIKAIEAWRLLEIFSESKSGRRTRSLKSIERLAKAFKLGKKGLSQREIAEECGVTEARVSLWRTENFYFDRWLYTRGGSCYVDDSGKQLDRTAYWFAISSIIRMTELQALPSLRDARNAGIFGHKDGDFCYELAARGVQCRELGRLNAKRKKVVKRRRSTSRS